MHDEDQSLVNIAENSTSLLIVHIYNFTPPSPPSTPDAHRDLSLDINKYQQISTTTPLWGGTPDSQILAVEKQQKGAQMTPLRPPTRPDSCGREPPTGARIPPQSPPQGQIHLPLTSTTLTCTMNFCHRSHPKLKPPLTPHDTLTTPRNILHNSPTHFHKLCRCVLLNVRSAAPGPA